MKDITHNQPDHYEEKGVTRKNVNGLSIASMLRRYTYLEVGRNKPVRAAAKTGVSGKAHPNFPETPTLANAGRTYSGLRLRLSFRNLSINMRSHALLAISLTVLSGCSAWSSNPARTQADYGASVRNLVSNQIYNPNKAQHPKGLLPSGIEGNKAQTILEGRTYRGDIGNPMDVNHSQLGNPGISGRGGSGSSAR